ncbi:MAG: phosphatase PAP2 family protein [Acidobacteriia bacterium]|nr:phosphatase PAP2 family protein [Terriglobia bacterium]
MSLPLLVVVATTALLRPVLAGEPALTLGLVGHDEEARPFEAGWPAPAPARFGLGADPGVLTPASPPRNPSGMTTGDARTRAQTSAPAVPSLAALPHRVWQDFGVLVKRPLSFDSHDWTRLAIGAGLVGAVTVFDVRLRDSLQAHSSASSRNLANRIRPIGTWGGVAAMGVLLGVGEWSGDAGLAATGADGLEASLFAGAFVAPVVKELAGRQRPNAGSGSGAFEPVSRGQSFPSGEATEAFTLAAVVSNHTASPVLRGVAWGLAGLVGCERMELNAHWASDVVAGALIGSAVGSWVSRHHGSDADGGHRLALGPMVGPGLVGVTGALSW